MVAAAAAELASAEPCLEEDRQGEGPRAEGRLEAGQLAAGRSAEPQWEEGLSAEGPAEAGPEAGASVEVASAADPPWPWRFRSRGHSLPCLRRRTRLGTCELEQQLDEEKHFVRNVICSRDSVFSAETSFCGIRARARALRLSLEGQRAWVVLGLERVWLGVGCYLHRQREARRRMMALLASSEM